MDQVDEVKSKIDIVEVISSYVGLKKAGRNFSGLCPFHSEKTPSFIVTPDRQVFKCFGCGEGGDVFTFLEKIENWDFRETLEELAKRAGVKLKSFGRTESGGEKEKLLTINKTAAKFFNYILLKHKLGEEAREYLKKRGVGVEMWVKFGLGYSPDSWDKTLSALKKKGFTEGDIAASGLVVSREGRNRGYYDRFRGRLMFPIMDVRGNVLGFSGRVIGRDATGAKYVNSPETPVFNKGSVLFGFFQTRDFIRDKNEAILVEGEFDMISLFEAGFRNVVASKGTALTEAQVKILGRTCETVAVCFDTDVAGDKAARRGIEMLDAAGLIVKVIKLGEYHDPDEFVRANKAGFGFAVKNAVNFYDFLIESAKSRFDANSVLGKKKIGAELLPVVSGISDSVVRAHYLGQLAGILGVEPALIFTDKANSSEATDTGVPTLDKNKKDDIEVFFLALLVLDDKIDASLFGVLAPEDFETKQCGAFWKAIRDIIGDSKFKSKRKVLETLPESFKSFVDDLYLLNLDREYLDDDLRRQEVLELAVRIREKSLKKQLNELSVEMHGAEKAEDWIEVDRLTRKFDSLSKKLKKEVADA